MKGNKSSTYLVYPKKSRFIQAVATPIAPASADSAEYRKQLAAKYGFDQIGEPLPDNVTLKDIINTLPKKVRFIRSCTLHCFQLM